MELQTMDSDLNAAPELAEADLIWINVRKEPFHIYGVYYDKGEGRFVRMPREVAAAVSKDVLCHYNNTAGGRVKFRTDSTYIAIKAVMDNTKLMNHIPLTGQSGFDLYRKTKTGDIFFHTFRPPMGVSEGYSASTYTDGKMYEYTINFPLYDRVKELYVALKRGSHLEATAPYRHEKPIVYYGSSITQGGCASRPGNAYQAYISRRLNVDFINLGFSSGAKGEETMIAYMASLDMSVFVCDYDHNAGTAEHLKKTLGPVYRGIRTAHPDVPIILVSATDVLIKGNNRPWNEAFVDRLDIVRHVYEEGIAAGDQNLYFVSGADLFAGECWDSCTVDDTHPNDLGFYRMAMGLEKVIKPLLK